MEVGTVEVGGDLGRNGARVRQLREAIVSSIDSTDDLGLVTIEREGSWV